MTTQRQTEVLEELLVWTRFANRRAILDTWDTILNDDRHLLAYELSDGTRTQQQVAKAVGISQPAVSNLWAKWRRLGIARTVEKSVCHIARPSDFGMERAIKLRASFDDHALHDEQ